MNNQGGIMDIVIKNLTKTLYVLVCAVFIFQSVGCGTLMYPERRGQRGGRIDAGVAVLDGVGLLFFLIPGVIAYAVDFSNGTIYLRGGSFRSSLDIKNIKQVKFDPKHTTLAGIERIIREQTGYVVKFDQSNMRIVKLKSTKDMMVQFAQVLPGLRVDRLSLVR
jgi:hypothetical protein